MLEKGVFVHYLNFRDCPKGVKQYMAENIIPDHPDKYQADSFEKFLQWVRNRNFYDLIISDNCDEILHSQKEELQSAVEMVIEKSGF